MIDPPYVTALPAAHIAVIHLTVPRAEIQKVMGPGIGEVLATVAAQGIKPAGAWFTHHFKLDPNAFDFEVGVPVATPVKAAGRVKPGERPVLKVARTVYHGGYEGLAAAWGEFMRWIAASGHTPAADLWECYVAGPESGDDPAKWRTEFNKPLAG